MSHRYGVRANVDEQRRLQREPVHVWKKEWVLPSNTVGAYNDVKILKWVRTPEVIRFDVEEEHLVGEETMAVMEIDQVQPINTITTNSIINESENQIVSSADVTQDLVPISTPTGGINENESSSQKIDVNLPSNEGEQRIAGEESMDVTMDQDLEMIKENAPAAAANPDTAAIHESVGIVETSIPEKSIDGKVDSPAPQSQIELQENELSIPSLPSSEESTKESQSVPLTSQIESSHPLSQMSLPVSTESSVEEDSKPEEEKEQEEESVPSILPTAE